MSKYQTMDNKTQELLRLVERSLTVNGIAAWSLDLETGEVLRSREHDKIFGHEESLNHWDLQTFMSHVHPADIQNVQTSFKQSIGKEHFEITFRILPPQNTIERWVEVKGSTVFSSSGKPQKLVGLTRDVTEMMMSQVRLVEASKMRSLGEMAGGIAHEINNPLTIIKLKSDILKSKIETDNLDKATVVSDLNKISETVDRISDIIRALRRFSRESDTDQIASVNLLQVIKDTVDLVRTKFRHESIEVLIEVPESVDIECRPAAIAQAIMNCLINSKEALLSQAGPRWIKLVATSNSTESEIRIIDSGSGVDDEVIRKMYEPFFSTKRENKKLGLGLSISKGLIEAHSGSFYYDSTQPNTTFVIKLPRKQSVPQVQY